MSSSLVPLSTIPDTIVKVENTTSYQGFKVNVQSVDIFVSVTLCVNVAFLLNGTLDKSQPNDGTYNYMNRFIMLTGTDYAQWGNDDTYLVNYVKNNMGIVLASTLKPRPNFLGLQQNRM